MAKLPKKITATESAKETTLRQFVSTAARKPVTASAVTRINLTMTEEDLARSAGFQEEGAISRADVYRAALVALENMPVEARRELFEEIRKTSPKAGRPPVNK
ncbi:hypothetical protein [Candidatus Pantoea soli]|uniref:DMP19 family protein n=1 Tax=Candidatus Pantoea soli TaxID=3098669 RepID=A0A518XJW5_9GAMM|nr:hypothetical protein [Pantoea soli]QDY44484.1 hypothetical protein D8B20_21395 [Pantoea soli]